MTRTRIAIGIIFTAFFILAFGPIGGTIVSAAFCWMLYETRPKRCPRCKHPMVSNYQLGQDECRSCGYGQYWK